LTIAGLAQADEGRPPRVVASIAPVQALAEAVMDGWGEPTLLVRGHASPHDHQLRPSDSRALQEADLVIRVGPGLETFLERPLASLSEQARVITLVDAPGVELLPSRAGGVWEEGHGHEEAHAQDDANEVHDHEPYDPHIWLSPANGRAMLRAIAEGLSAADPARASLYRANAERAAGVLAELDQELDQRLAPVRDKPFVVFHDAFRYLEAAYDLRSLGSITVSPERPPSAKRLAELIRKIQESGALCVFGETRTRSPLAVSLAEDLGIDVGELDPMESLAGARGLDAYTAVMRRNADALVECLSQRS
jgi:zinc transport system substrate-binding protein